MGKKIIDKINILVDKLFAAMHLSTQEPIDIARIEDSTWNKIQARIAIKSVNRHLYNAWRVGAVAASILCASLIGLLWFSSTKTIDAKLILLTNLTERNKEYLLSDGSLVLLRPKSQITFIDAGLPIREISLNGEGYFEIKTDSSNPFTIQTDAGVVKVLGTKFGLRADGVSPTAELVLTEGVVEFVSGSSTYSVKPNQKITVDKRSGDIDIKSVNPDFELGWKAAYLQFTNQPLVDVLKKLSNIHQVDIEIEDVALGNTRFTGRLNNNYSIDKILNDLSLIIKIKYETRGGVYIVSTKHD